MTRRFRRVVRNGAVLLAFVLVISLVASVRAFSNGQAASLVLGQSDFTTNTAATTQSGMNIPSGVAVDPASSKVFVADNKNNRVLRFASSAALVNGAPAESVFGQPDFTTSTPATTNSGMNGPQGVAMDSAGRLWVADTDNNRVLRFDSATATPNGPAANGVLGQSDFTTSAPVTPLTSSGMNAPFGVVVDQAGVLWVADANNNRVLRFDNAATLDNGAPADGVLGQPDFSTNAADTTQRGMFYPNGLAVDHGGSLWVADTDNSRVLRFDNAATIDNGAPANGVLGQSDFSSSTRATTQSGISDPEGLAVDSAGRLWVADTVNSRVLRFDNATTLTNGAPANGVLGQSDFSSGLFDTTQSTLHFPRGVAVDDAGRLWVADNNNNRVLRFNDTKPVYLPFVAR